MTDTATTERPSAVYITDAELIRRLGVPRDKARMTIRALDQNPRSGFPKKNPLWGGRRHWPSVEAYLEAYEKSRMGASPNHKRGGHDDD